MVARLSKRSEDESVRRGFLENGLVEPTRRFPFFCGAEPNDLADTLLVLLGARVRLLRREVVTCSEVGGEAKALALFIFVVLSLFGAADAVLATVGVEPACEAAAGVAVEGVEKPNEEGAEVLTEFGVPLGGIVEPRAWLEASRMLPLEGWVEAVEGRISRCTTTADRLVNIDRCSVWIFDARSGMCFA